MKIGKFKSTNGFLHRYFVGWNRKYESKGGKKVRDGHT